MKKLPALAALLLVLTAAPAQPDFAKLAVGLDVGFDVHQLDGGEKPRWIPGVQVEVPIQRFSLGAGFAREFYHPYDYYVYAGSTVDRIEGGQTVTYFVSDARSFRPAYWTVPLSVEYRVHRCQCVFLHAGVSLDFLDTGTPDKLLFSGAELRQRPFDQLTHEQLFKSYTHSYNVGVGFNLFANDFLRFTARPSFVWSENPEIYTQAPFYIRTFRMNFGVQFAVWRER